MSSSIGRIYDDYGAYEELCKAIGVESLGIRDNESFYDHEKKLMEKHGWSRTYFGYQKKENDTGKTARDI